MNLQNIAMLILLLIDSISNAQINNLEITKPIKDTLATPRLTNKPIDFNSKFGVLLSAYIELKNSLVNNDPNSASSSGKIIMKAIEEIDSKNLTNKQNLAWMLYADKISKDADHIKNKPEIEYQREYFMSLSKNLFELAKAFKVNDDDLYYQFCPMANDGKGAYWISEQSKIRNPYYGKKMLSCGSTKETLPAKRN